MSGLTLYPVSGDIHVRGAARISDRSTANSSLLAAWRMFFLCCSASLFGNISVHAQCPDSGQTKVMKSSQGTGYYFYRFIGDSSFRYFLDGKTFSLNEKDDPGKTFIFIDDFAYESILVEKTDLANYVKSSKTIDILRAQAKHQQDYFKKVDASMIITDYGPANRTNPNGSDDRLFYLWKKESPPGNKAATQYLVSTLVKGGVVVLSIMPTKASISEDDVFTNIQKYTSHFDLISSDLCLKVLSAPTAP
jgi:hypothetical protein